MTTRERQIRENWRRFQRKNEMDNKIYLSNEEITKFMSKMFG